MAAGAGASDAGGVGPYVRAITDAIDALDADLLGAARDFVRINAQVPGTQVPAALAHCRGLLEAARGAVSAIPGLMEANASSSPGDNGDLRPGPALRSVDRLLRDGEDG